MLNQEVLVFFVNFSNDKNAKDTYDYILKKELCNSTNIEICFPLGKSFIEKWNPTSIQLNKIEFEPIKLGQDFLSKIFEKNKIHPNGVLSYSPNVFSVLHTLRKDLMFPYQKFSIANIVNNVEIIRNKQHNVKKNKPCKVIVLLNEYQEIQGKLLELGVYGQYKFFRVSGQTAIEETLTEAQKLKMLENVPVLEKQYQEIIQTCERVYLVSKTVDVINKKMNFEGLRTCVSLGLTIKNKSPTLPFEKILWIIKKIKAAAGGDDRFFRAVGIAFNMLDVIFKEENLYVPGVKDFIDPEMEKKFIVLQNLGHKCNGCFFSTSIKMSVGLLSALMVVMAAAYASYSEEPSAWLSNVLKM